MISSRFLAVLAVLALALVPSSGSADGRFGAGGFRSHGHSRSPSHLKGVKPHGGVVAVKPIVPRHFGFDPRPSVFPTLVDPWKSWGVRGHSHRHFFARPGGSFFASGGVIGSYAPSPIIYAAPAYAATAAVVAVPTPAPMPTVIEYATGRYELRGDGITTAYVWVWIPNPPPPPAAPPPPPTAPPAAPPASGAPSSSALPIAEPASRSRSEIYRWTDDEGVTTWTDSLESIPERYRGQMQRLRTPSRSSAVR